MPGLSWTVASRVQRLTNSSICDADDSLTTFKSVIHLPFKRASLTVLFFFLEMEYTVGAICFGISPWSHVDSQNLAFSPSPSVIVVAAANRFLSLAVHGVGIPTQGLRGSFHSFQSHRSLSALANFLRCRIPRPPSFVGLHAIVHATLHLPPTIWSVPAHRKRFLRRSISSSTAAGAFNAER